MSTFSAACNHSRCCCCIDSIDCKAAPTTSQNFTNLSPGNISISFQLFTTWQMWKYKAVELIFHPNVLNAHHIDGSENFEHLRFVSCPDSSIPTLGHWGSESVRQKDKWKKESFILWCQGSFALLQCFFPFQFENVVLLALLSQDS